MKNIKELKQLILREKIKRLLVEPIDTDELIDCIVEAVTNEVIDNCQVDVPNTGYFGIIVKKENK